MSNSPRRHLLALQITDSLKKLDGVMMVEENYPLRPSPQYVVIYQFASTCGTLPHFF